MLLFRAGYPGPVCIEELEREVPNAGRLVDSLQCGRACLARAGKLLVFPCWDLVLEMLDENRQMHNFREQQPNGQLVPDEAAARLTMVYALREATAALAMGARNAVPSEFSPGVRSGFTPPSINFWRPVPSRKSRTQADTTRLPGIFRCQS